MSTSQTNIIEKEYCVKIYVWRMDGQRWEGYSEERHISRFLADREMRRALAEGYEAAIFEREVTEWKEVVADG